MCVPDYLEVAQAIADELKHVGAEIVIALTHFREPNDLQLLEEACNMYSDLQAIVEMCMVS